MLQNNSLPAVYGLWYENPRPPSRWIAQDMGYEGLWVNRSRGIRGLTVVLFYAAECTVNLFSGALSWPSFENNKRIKNRTPPSL